MKLLIYALASTLLRLRCLWETTFCLSRCIYLSEMPLSMWVWLITIPCITMRAVFNHSVTRLQWALAITYHSRISRITVAFDTPVQISIGSFVQSVLYSCGFYTSMLCGRRGVTGNNTVISIISVRTIFCITFSIFRDQFSSNRVQNTPWFDREDEMWDASLRVWGLALHQFRISNIVMFCTAIYPVSSGTYAVEIG